MKSNNFYNSVDEIINDLKNDVLLEIDIPSAIELLAKRYNLPQDQVDFLLGSSIVYQDNALRLLVAMYESVLVESY